MGSGDSDAEATVVLLLIWAVTFGIAWAASIAVPSRFVQGARTVAWTWAIFGFLAWFFVSDLVGGSAFFGRSANGLFYVQSRNLHEVSGSTFFSMMAFELSVLVASAVALGSIVDDWFDRFF